MLVSKYANLFPNQDDKNIAQSIQFSKLSILVDICATFQASSADCERGFSLMNNIKTKGRNRLGAEHLDQLMRIKSHLAYGKEVNLDAVYSRWISHKDRREKTHTETTTF